MSRPNELDAYDKHVGIRWWSEKWEMLQTIAASRELSLTQLIRSELSRVVREYENKHKANIRD